MSLCRLKMMTSGTGILIHDDEKISNEMAKRLTIFNIYYLISLYTGKVGSHNFYPTTKHLICDSHDTNFK